MWRHEKQSSRTPRRFHTFLGRVPRVFARRDELREFGVGFLYFAIELLNVLVHLDLSVRLGPCCLGLQFGDIRFPLIQLRLKFLFIQFFLVHRFLLWLMSIVPRLQSTASGSGL